MIKLQEKDSHSFQKYKMSLAASLMYEMALRRQDILTLTFNHFKNLDASDDGGLTIRFMCIKQNV